MLHVLHHSIMDSLKLFPFLFFTYLIMGILQNAASEKTARIIKSAGRTGPLWGSLFGAFPQCGFSAAASYFYVRRAITLGTLISIYMSTSDEMLPIFISEQVPVKTMVSIVAAKVVIGMISGFLAELLFGWLGKRHRIPVDMTGSGISASECSCCSGRSVAVGALIHSVKIWALIVIISIGIGAAIHFIGRNAISGIFSDIPVLGELIAGLVGLIPNCGASVVITKLYLNGIIGTGPMMSGLLASAGVGLLVLFKENSRTAGSFLIVLALYGMSVGWGVLFEIAGVSFL